MPTNPDPTGMGIDTLAKSNAPSDEISNEVNDLKRRVEKLEEAIKKLSGSSDKDAKI